MIGWLVFSFRLCGQLSMKQCFGCGGFYEDIEGPVHKYMDSTPGCWKAYGEILAKEYSDLAYYSVHRKTVDAYAIQHPCHPDSQHTPTRQQIQSVGIHLIRLCLFIEHNLSPDEANAVMVRATKFKHTFHWLIPPDTPSWLTPTDIIKADRPEVHIELVNIWARDVWNAYEAHHDTVKQWLSKAGF